MSDESTDASEPYSSSRSDSEEVLTITSSSEIETASQESDPSETTESSSRTISEESQLSAMDSEPLEGQVFEVPLINVVQQAVIVSQSDQDQNVENQENREGTPLTPTQNEDLLKPLKSSSKKRKRPNRIESDTDDDDGLTCPICLDHWEMTGAHRLVSLKCGHLFGESCIRRWLRESGTGNKLCPHCKTKALPRDIRHLYARKMVILDNSEQVRLQKELDEERQKVTSLQMELQMARMENKVQMAMLTKLQEQINVAQHAAATTNAKLNSAKTSIYKLFMEKNIEITNQPGCRVLKFSQNSKLLLASQKSSATIFPGYGIRFIDTPSFRPCNYLHISPNSLRDLCFDAEETIFLAASSEKTCKLYDVNTKTAIDTLTPSDTSQIWSCGFDKSRTKLLYLGAQNGTTFVYDIRQTRAFLKELKTTGDFTPVINVWSVPPNNEFPFGGCLVAKLSSCWFFEYTHDQNTIPSRLNIDGPFVSMQYDSNNDHLLINARPSVNYPTSRHILAKLIKLNETMTTIQVIHEYLGSKIQSYISRSSIVNYNNNLIVAAYCEDQKILKTWSKNNECTRTQLSERIQDTCALYINNESTHLAALTDSKCRIYKFLDSTS
uniref:CSON003662 protein n=1 Tax=Culicoides sonorensis TaxID=179676 RepID=A0A336LMF4_CULSO